MNWWVKYWTYTVPSKLLFTVPEEPLHAPQNGLFIPAIGASNDVLTNPLTAHIKNLLAAVMAALRDQFLEPIIAVI